MVSNPWRTLAVVVVAVLALAGCGGPQTGAGGGSDAPAGRRGPTPVESLATDASGPAPDAAPDGAAPAQDASAPDAAPAPDAGPGPDGA
jgi:hypothetical protein